MTTASNQLFFTIWIRSGAAIFTATRPEMLTVWRVETDLTVTFAQIIAFAL